MSYGDDTMRGYFQEKIYAELYQAIPDLATGIHPFGFPMYACLHAMVESKRRILNTPYMYIRIAGNKIDLRSSIQSGTRDGGQYSRNGPGRREHESSFTYEPAYFQDILDAAGSYGKPIAPEAKELAKKIDELFISLKKEKWQSLEDGYDEVGKRAVDQHFKNGLQTSIVLAGYKMGDINVSENYTEFTIEHKNIGDLQLQCNHDIDDETKTLKFTTYDLELKNMVVPSISTANLAGEVKELQRLAEASIMHAFQGELRRKQCQTDKQTEVEEVLKGYEREATDLIKNVYGTSLEELKDAMTLSKVI